MEHATLVVIKAILPVIGDEQVFPSIVVVIADAYALTPACGVSESGNFGHVGERAVVIVAVEMIGWGIIRWKSFQRRSVHQENVRPAIVIVVKDCHPGSGGLEDVLLCLPASEHVHHRDPGILCDIDEVRQWHRSRFGGIALLGK